MICTQRKVRFTELVPMRFLGNLALFTILSPFSSLFSSLLFSLPPLALIACACMCVCVCVYSVIVKVV